jgi:hypothetical protein
MIAHNAILLPEMKGKSRVEMDFNISQPPLWTYSLLETAKFLNRMDQIGEFYPLCQHNLQWWEKNRFNEEYGLFGAPLTGDQYGCETEMHGSPRFSHQYTGRKWQDCLPDQKRDLLLVDLNAQMADYYQNMGVFGSLLGDEQAGEYFQKAESLQDQAQKFLFDPQSKFFYDFDLETQTIQPIKTIAGFWSLFGGLASKGQIQPLLTHLLDPSEFWTELPVPSIAINEPFYTKDIWHGAVSIPQNYWLIIGLKRFGQNAVVSKLTQKIFQYLNDSFNLYGRLYEHYPPMSLNVDSLGETVEPGMVRGTKCKSISSRNTPDYLGHAIVHSLFYRGLLGAEIVDDSVSFVPDWGVMPKELQFSFYYHTRKVNSFMSKMTNKMLEIT